MPMPPSVADGSHDDIGYELQWRATNKAPRYPGMGVLKQVPRSFGQTGNSKPGRYKIPLAVPSLPTFSHSPDEVARYTRDGVVPVASSGLSADLAATTRTVRTASSFQRLPFYQEENGHPAGGVVMNRAGDPTITSAPSLVLSIDADVDGAQSSNALSEQAEPPPLTALYEDDSSLMKLRYVAQLNDDTGSPDYTVEERSPSAESLGQSSDVEQVLQEPTVLEALWNLYNRIKAKNIVTPFF